MEYRDYELLAHPTEMLYKGYLCTDQVSLILGLERYSVHYTHARILDYILQGDTSNEQSVI